MADDDYDDDPLFGVFVGLAWALTILAVALALGAAAATALSNLGWL